jgi:hypothetical protein
MENQIVKIPLEALNALLEKVAERPFKEVAQLINQVQKAVSDLNKPEGNNDPS